MNIIASNGFLFGINEPTRVTHSTSTCLDHFIYQNVPDCETEVLRQQSFSDHYPVQLIGEFEQKQIKTCYFLEIISLQKIQKKLNAI